jgi:hypothetical protein
MALFVVLMVWKKQPAFAGVFIGSPAYVSLSKKADVTIWIQEGQEDHEGALIGPFSFQRKLFVGNDYFRNLLLDSGMAESQSSEVTLHGLSFPIFDHLVDMVVLGFFDGFNMKSLQSDETYLDQFFQMVEYYDPNDGLKTSILAKIEQLIESNTGKDLDLLVQLLPRIDFYSFLMPVKQKIREALVKTLEDLEFVKEKGISELQGVLLNSQQDLEPETFKWLSEQIEKYAQPSLKSVLLRETEQSVVKSILATEKHIQGMIQCFDALLKEQKSATGSFQMNGKQVNRIFYKVTGLKVRFLKLGERRLKKRCIDLNVEECEFNPIKDRPKSNSRAYASYLLKHVADHYQSLGVKVTFLARSIIFRWK